MRPVVGTVHAIRCAHTALDVTASLRDMGTVGVSAKHDILQTSYNKTTVVK